MFTKEFKRRIVTQYNNGKSVKTLCAENHVSKSSIYNWIKESKYIESYRNKGKITYLEYCNLQRENTRLIEEVEILHRSRCSVGADLNTKLKEMVRLQNEHGYSVHALCRAFEVRRSAFYHHTLRSPEMKMNERSAEELKPVIKKLFEESKNRFGSRMIRAKLVNMGYTASQTRVASLMKEMGLICNSQRKTLPEYRRTYAYSGHGFAINRLRRQFTQAKPNLVWVSDITYLRTKERIYYLCVILDLYSRKVIAHNLKDSRKVTLITKCFQTAFEERKPQAGLMFHSDQGAEYYSHELKALLDSCGAIQSFSNVGTPCDNAVVESFFASLKREQIYQNIYENMEDLKDAVDEYIGFYNNERPHQRLDMLTPTQVEDAYWFSQNNTDKTIKKEATENWNSKNFVSN